jgi:endonuclease YncB( thermonuclease family)
MHRTITAKGITALIFLAMISNAPLYAQSSKKSHRLKLHGSTPALIVADQSPTGSVVIDADKLILQGKVVNLAGVKIPIEVPRCRRSAHRDIAPVARLAARTIRELLSNKQVMCLAKYEVDRARYEGYCTFEEPGRGLLDLSGFLLAEGLATVTDGASDVQTRLFAWGREKKRGIWSLKCSDGVIAEALSIN